MPITATLDPRKLIVLSSTDPGTVISVSNPPGKLVFTPAVAGVAGTPVELALTSIAGFDVPAGVTLILDAALANGKAIVGSGTVIARAISASTGENISGYTLFTDKILLADGAAYTLTAEQALLSRIGSSDADAADLRSTSGLSKITLIAATGSDLREILLDKNDSVILTLGQAYTLSAEQAVVAKVGTGGVGDLTACSQVTVHATSSADLSSLKCESNDVIVLAEGRDYTLTSALVAFARVSVNATLGALGNLTAAGAVTVKASTAGGEDLSSIQASGIDVYELALGKAYTLNASQVAAVKVGATGVTGNTSGAGQLTIKAGTQSDLTRVATKVVVDKGVADLAKSDILILTANLDYRLTSDQARVSKVGTASTAKAGELGDAGIITVVAGLNAQPAGPSRTEDLSLFSSKGVNFYELAAGADYIMTTTQAKAAKVGAGGALGNLAATGNLTLIAQAGENLTQTSITGVDEYRLAEGQTYTLSAEQALKSRVMLTNQTLGGYGDLSKTKSTVSAGAMVDLTPITVDPLGTLMLTADSNYVLTSAQAKVAKVDDGTGGGTAGALAKAGTVTVRAGSRGEELATTLAGVQGYDAIVLTAGSKYSLTTEQARMAQVVSASVTNGIAGTAENTASVTQAVAGTAAGLINAGIRGSVFIEYAYNSTATPKTTVSSAKFVAQTSPNPANWADAANGRDITQFVTVSGTGTASTLTIAPGAGLSTSAITVSVTGAIANLNVVSVGLNNPISAAGDLTAAGAATLVANAITGEDLSGVRVLGIKAIALTVGKDYTLTDIQAGMARMGATGASGDLTVMTGAPATAKSGAIIIVGTAGNFDYTQLKTDANDVIVLTAGFAGTLTAAQAAQAKVGVAGVAGDLTGTGNLRVVADVNGTDLSRIKLDAQSQYVIELTGGQNYTLSSSQVAKARVGANGALTKAGAITVMADAAGENLALITAPGIDVFQLTATAASYTLRTDQALLARVGSNGVLGDLSGVNGTINLQVVAAPTVPLDLTRIILKASDSLQLTEGSNYILTAKQAATATVLVNGNPGVAGDLLLAGQILVVPGAGDNLSVLLADVKGVNQIVLDPMGSYTLTDAQARMAVYGKAGAPGELGNRTGTGTLTVIAGNTPNLTDIQIDSRKDSLILQTGRAYTVTAEQAAVSKFSVAGSMPGALGRGADDIDSLITVLALKGTDLTKLTLDANDGIVLGAGQKYTLTSAQARIAVVESVSGNTVTTSSAGILTTAGAVRVIASNTTEDLSGLVLDGNDTLQLTAGIDYTITAAQAASTVIGLSGAKGKLTAAGVITVKAGTGGDLTALALDTPASSTPPTGPSTTVDVIELTAGQNYTLTSSQVLIARVGPTGTAGQLTTAGTITVVANSATEDLSVTLATATGVDKIVLAQGKNYSLTKEQIAVAQIGPGGTPGDLKLGGLIQLKSAPNGTTEDLSTLTAITGIDRIALKSGVNTTLTDEQAAIAVLGINTQTQNLRGTEIITIKANDHAADLSAILTDNNDLIHVGAFDYTINSAQVARLSTDGQTVTTAATPGDLVGTYTLRANAGGEDLAAVNTSAVDGILLTLGRKYTLTAEQAAIAKMDAVGAVVGNLSKAGNVIVVANASGDSGLKGKLGGVAGIDAIELAEGKGYTLSAGQALVARVGSSGALGNLTKTGDLAIDDTGATVSGRQDLTRLVLDASDTLALGTGRDYDLTSSQLAKAGATAATAGIVNLWGGAQGEDLSGIATANADAIILAAGRDYMLNVNQVAKTQVGVTGTAGNITKAGKVTLRLSDGDDISSWNTQMIKGVDVLQLMTADLGLSGVQYILKAGIASQVQVSLDATLPLPKFAKNTTSGVVGGGNTGADALVNAAGEWTFVNANDILAFWDGSTRREIKLVGVASVVADGTETLNLGF